MIRLFFERAPCAFALPLLASVSLFSSGQAFAQTVSAASVLPAVRVTATRFDEDPADLPFGVSVVTSDDIRQAGVSTVNEVLMKLLGVPGRLDLNGGGDYALDLRGFGGGADSNQVVIVDGVRISEADLGGTRLAGIPIDAVDRIEVIRGSAAVLYGEGATAGAIVITTKAATGQARQSNAQAYMAMGSHALTDVRAGGMLAAGGFSLDVAGNKRASDGHRDNFRSNVEGLSLTGQWRNDWLRIGARHAQDELQTGLPGALTADEYNANPRQTTHSGETAHIDNQRNGVFSEATLGAWQIGVDASKRKKVLVSLTPSSTYAYDIEARNQALRIRHSAPIGRLTNTVTAGLDRNEWTRVVQGSFGSTADQTAQAFYLKDDLALRGGTRLSAGVRQERATKSSTAAADSAIDERHNAWELGAVQDIGASTVMYARVGRSFRLANVDEIGFVVAGASLRPQVSRDIDLGARWANAGGRAELRFYRNVLHDEIGYDPLADGPFGPGANVNFDPTLRQGFEFEALHRWNAAVQLRLNAAARQAKFTDGAYDGNDIALVAKRTVAAGADWELGSGHKLNGLLNWVSSQSPNFANACRIPAHTTADLRYAYQTPHIELALGVANITDKKYYTQAFSCVGSVTSAIYPEDGRIFMASLRASF